MSLKEQINKQKPGQVSGNLSSSQGEEKGERKCVCGCGGGGGTELSWERGRPALWQQVAMWCRGLSRRGKLKELGKESVPREGREKDKDFEESRAIWQNYKAVWLLRRIPALGAGILGRRSVSLKE